MTASDLFPPLEPFESGRLNVTPRHSLYWEQSGNPQGHPVVFLHGGPGAGASADHRRFFDPRSYRIVILDQRGAGRSTPLETIEFGHCISGRRTPMFGTREDTPNSRAGMLLGTVQLL